MDSLTSTFLNNNTINFNAGASLTYNIVNLGSLTTSDGTYTNDGSITLGASGDIDMTGFKTLAGTGTFTNEQSLSLQDDVIDVVLDGGTGTLGLDGTVTIDGKVIIAPTTVVDGAGPSFVGGVGTLVNQGVQSIDDGSTFSVATLRNEGTLDFTTLTSTITSDVIENVVGANVNFAVDTTIDMVAGQTLTNAGLVQLQGSANLNFSDGLIANSGTLDITAAASTLVVTNGNVSMLSGGDVTGAGTLDLTSSNFNIDTGVGFTLGTAGSGPDLEMSTSNITGAGTLVNESAISTSGAGSISVATFTNSTGGVLNQSNGTLAVSSVFENLASADVVVDLSAGSAAISFTNDFSNSGLVKFDGANVGAITVGGGAGTLTNSASGAIQIIIGSNTINGTVVSNGVLEVKGTGLLSLGADFVSNSGAVVVLGEGAQSGKLGGVGTLFNAGVLTLDNGTLSGNTNDSSGAINLFTANNVNSGALEFGQDSSLFVSVRSGRGISAGVSIRPGRF